MLLKYNKLLIKYLMHFLSISSLLAWVYSSIIAHLHGDKIWLLSRIRLFDPWSRITKFKFHKYFIKEIRKRKLRQSSFYNGDWDIVSLPYSLQMCAIIILVISNQ